MAKVMQERRAEELQELLNALHVERGPRPRQVGYRDAPAAR